jgi:hypothetical protein
MDDVVSHFMNQVQFEDLLNVGFMKPFEMALKSHKTDKSVPNNTLAQGLLYAQKD